MSKLLHSSFWKTATPEAVEAAIKKGAEMSARDRQGWTPLHFAAINSTNPAVIRLLVEHGADLNARGNDGETPLDLAEAACNDPEIAKALIELGDAKGGHTSGSETATRPSGTPGPLDRREFIAALVMAGMLTAGVPRGEARDGVLADCADVAVSAADALIERLGERL